MPRNNRQVQLFSLCNFAIGSVWGGRALAVSSELSASQMVRGYFLHPETSSPQLSISRASQAEHLLLDVPLAHHISVGHPSNAIASVLVGSCWDGSHVTRPTTCTSYLVMPSCPVLSVPADSTNSCFLSQACNF